MKCIKCGKENKKKAKYCASCGASLLDVSAKKQKNIKRRIILTVFILVFIAAVSGVILLVYGTLQENRHKDNAQAAVTEFLERYKACDPAASELLAGTGDIEMSYEGISSSFADGLSYEIISCRKDSDNLYIVEIQTTTIDFEKLFTVSTEETVENYGEDNVTDHLLDVMAQKITDDTCETKTIPAQVSVLKINEEYKIQMDGSLANALSGGMNDYLESLTGGE